LKKDRTKPGHALDLAELSLTKLNVELVSIKLATTDRVHKPNSSPY
jgi:hypothetical protein